MPMSVSLTVTPPAIKTAHFFELTSRNYIIYGNNFNEENMK